MSDKLNLIDTIASHDKFSTFTRLMASSGTNRVFDADGPFTVFVPTNDAFAQVPEHKINELLNEKNQEKLKSLLSYHILPGKVMAANLGSAPTRKAVSGEELRFSDSNGLKVNGASVQARNIEATNGVVHAVDAVLAPFVVTKSTGGFALASVPKTNGASTAPTGEPVTAASAASASGTDRAKARFNIKPLI
jgi:uncharacterized surface protein with fasciclin (FAS1) repeats